MERLEISKMSLKHWEDKLVSTKMKSGWKYQDMNKIHLSFEGKMNNCWEEDLNLKAR